MTHSPMRVYIAGPYTAPDPITNTRRAGRWFDAIMSHGFQPFSPHLMSHSGALFHVADYQRWMAYCFEWVAASHVLVRIPGHSPGSDDEMRTAEARGIPMIIPADIGADTEAIAWTLRELKKHAEKIGTF